MMASVSPVQALSLSSTPMLSGEGPSPEGIALCAERGPELGYDRVSMNSSL